MPPQTDSIVTALSVRALPRSVDALHTLVGLRVGLGERCSYPWLLDSALPSRRLGRFSFVGADPYLVLRARGRALSLDGRRAVRPDIPIGEETRTGDPFETARSLLPPAPLDASSAAFLPFVGGAVGYWGYELASQLEPIRLHGRDDLGLPDLVLLFIDRLIAVDVVEGRAFAVGLGFAASEGEARSRADTAADEIASAARTGVSACETSRPCATPIEVGALFDESAHAAAVACVGKEIAAGNVYQANVTHRAQLPLRGADPLAVYRALRQESPAPFAAYLELPEAAILSSSPERFLRLDPAGRVESRPIKGTRPRGETPECDERLARELAGSEKDRAENLMITDLVRNDLGRVCEPGSVTVPELMAIERYATVFQMVSTVAGRLRADCDATDLIRATFPPGSMTGAPKIAAIQLLDRLEPYRRGVYSGALGYLDARGGLDLSVVIRTLIVADGRATLHVGGGIVADSEASAEYRETLDKARALVAALDRTAVW